MRKSSVFCHKLEDCVILYQSFAMSLGDSSYVPAGECTLQNALFGMFHAKVTKSDKDILLDSFMKSDGNCRVIFATIAFGMGVNIRDIHTVIHIGPSSSVDSYVQESGRAGRDGQQSHAIILLYPGANVGKDIKAYCRSRKYVGECSFYGVILAIAPGPYHCTTVVMFVRNLAAVDHAFWLYIPRFIACLANCSEPSLVKGGEEWEEERSRILRQMLTDIARRQREREGAKYVQDELMTGISEQLIEQIVANAHNISNIEELRRLCCVWGNEKEIMMTIDTVRKMVPVSET